MYESRIAADHLTVASVEGLAPEIDVLAASNGARHAFLRAAWYAAGSRERLRTLVLRRPDGAPLAAIPTVPFGPALVGARKVPGSYWPLRSVPVAPRCTVFELAHALGHPAARSLGPVLRIGPARCDDASVALLVAAARLANWTVLARPAGTSWIIDCDAAREQGWPRPSSLKRFARLERRLGRLGAVSWSHVRGTGWNDRVLKELGEIEAASWIATRTDGSGAKFMLPRQRAAWRGALADPVLAQMLCATILRLDGRAVAFSFDLDDRAVRYGIAGSYRSDLARHEIGKLANHRALADSLAAGLKVMDLGAGDSGYKRAMGAEEGYRLTDLLFVRHPAAAALLSCAWGASLTPGTVRSPATPAGADG